MSVMPASPSVQAAPFRVGFVGASAGGTASIQLTCPWLAGAKFEELFPAAVPVAEREGIALYRCGDLLVGHGRERFVPQELAARTQSLYARIFAATRGRHLYRIWNYLPRINEHTAGLEHYRAFCQGRSLAFEAGLGGAFEPRLPAASAVGCGGDSIDVLFVAGHAQPTHVENPEQVPAYHYPVEHGPRAPSFARATVVADTDQRLTFVSGTAAIKGHRTIAPGRLGEQLACTLDNLRLISRAAGLGDDLGAGRSRLRHFKIYLRRPEHLPETQTHLELTLLRRDDVVTYLHADICRAALEIEIEATVMG